MATAGSISGWRCRCSRRSEAALRVLSPSSYRRETLPDCGLEGNQGFAWRRTAMFCVFLWAAPVPGSAPLPGLVSPAGCRVMTFSRVVGVDDGDQAHQRGELVVVVVLGRVRQASSVTPPAASAIRVPCSVSSSAARSASVKTVASARPRPG